MAEGRSWDVVVQPCPEAGAEAAGWRLVGGWLAALWRAMTSIAVVAAGNAVSTVQKQAAPT